MLRLISIVVCSVVVVGAVAMAPAVEAAPPGDSPFVGQYTGAVPFGDGGWNLKIDRRGAVLGTIRWKDGDYWIRGTLSGTVTNDGAMTAAGHRAQCTIWGCGEWDFQFTGTASLDDVLLDDTGDLLLVPDWPEGEGWSGYIIWNRVK
jgi:hypothetical protein